MTLILILISFTILLKAPNDNALIVISGKKIMPYESLFKAIVKVESGGDVFAIGDKNLKRKSYGVAQIRQIRLDHYFDLTGIRYNERDMFDYGKSKEVFMYFADRIGPYDFERIIRNWNGKWSLTDDYYKKVKSKL